MKKIGNRGFMMAEVVVVSVMVATVLVTLFTSVSRLSTAFNIRNKYHDLDALNVAVAANRELVKSGYINTLIASNSSNVTSNVINVTSLYSSYNRVNVYYFKVNSNTINTSEISDTVTTTKDFFEYLKNNVDADYNYYVAVELCKTEDDCGYYGLGVK